MLVKDFIKENSDILLRPVTEVEFQSVTDGAVFFCITTSGGKKPYEERKVVTAGYNLVVATTRDTDETAAMLYINTLALTQNGYAKVDIVTPMDIFGQGSKLRYHCRPLPINDPRRNGKFL